MPDLFLNKGVELMLRNKKIQEEEPSIFKLCTRKAISFFNKEFFFSIEFRIRNKTL